MAKKRKADYTPEEWATYLEQQRQRKKRKADCTPEEWATHLEKNRKYVLKGCARERALAHQQVLLNLVSERVGPQVFKDIETEIKGLI